MTAISAVLGKDLRRPLAALACAVGFSVAATVVRVALTHQLRPLYLVWNLLLGLLPLVFALALQRAVANEVRTRWKLALLGAWLAFFPNAPYILTDFVHLKSHLHPHFWTDLTLLLMFSWSGVLAGFLSLYIVQRLVERRLGPALSWCFVGVVAALTGVGIYLGRIERWNSWDLLLHPVSICSDAVALVQDAWRRGQPSRLAAFFALIVLIGHTSLYALLESKPSPHDDAR